MEAIERLNCDIGYDWEYEAGVLGVTAQPPERSWLRMVLGDDFFDEVVWVYFYGPEVDDAKLEYLKSLPQVQELSLWETNVTDAGLRNLGDLPKLQTLILSVNNQITDDGLLDLSDMRHLRLLHLEIMTECTPEGVKKLQEALPNCKIEY